MANIDRSWTPAPVPEHWSENRKRAVELCNLIPPGHWSSFANLAEAFNAMTGSNHSAFTFARLINDIPWRRKTAAPGEKYGPPTVPWHRIRNVKGQAIAYDHGPVTDNAEHWCSVRFNDEAGGQGLLHDGMARTSLFVDMHRMIAASGGVVR